MSAAIALAGQKGALWVSGRTLTRLMMVEFLAIHSSAFIGFVLFWKPEDFKNAAAKWVIFAALLAFYCAAAFGVGPDLFVMFVVGSALPYIGMMLPRGAATLQQMVARWAWSFFAFIAAVGPTGTPGLVNRWTDVRSVLWGSLIYFSLLFLAELSGLFYTHVADWEELARRTSPAESPVDRA